MSGPQPGDIGLSSSHSLIGRLVRLAQNIIGDDSLYTHCYIVLHDGNIIEAMPGKRGARFGKVADYPDAVYSTFNLTPDQRDSICEAAIRLEGTPYSFLDYVAIALQKWLPGSGMFKWVDNRVKRSDRAICSQLCGMGYRNGGVGLGEPAQYMTPGDIARLVLVHAGERFDGKTWV